MYSMFGALVLALRSWLITKRGILSRTWCWQLMNCGAWWPLLVNNLWSLNTTPDCFPVLTLVVSATIMLIEPQSWYSSTTSDISFAMLLALPSFRSSAASLISESGSFKTTARYSRPWKCLSPKWKTSVYAYIVFQFFFFTCQSWKPKFRLFNSYR